MSSIIVGLFQVSFLYLSNETELYEPVKQSSHAKKMNIKQHPEEYWASKQPSPDYFKPILDFV